VQINMARRNNNMVILGIDPGSRITGFGVIKASSRGHSYVASGCIKTKGQEMPSRLLEIFQGLSLIIQQYAPSRAAIEKVFIKKNPDSALKLGQARGVALVAIATHQLPLSEYAPRVIKQAVAGFGGADKMQIQQMIKIMLCLSDVPQKDAADALAIALCHAHHLRRHQHD
jgi:crossover junction endodeoxyribonuclease RuvC